MQMIAMETRDDSIIQDNQQEMRHIHEKKQGAMFHLKHWQNEMEMHR